MQAQPNDVSRSIHWRNKFWYFIAISDIFTATTRVHLIQRHTYVYARKYYQTTVSINEKKLIYNLQMLARSTEQLATRTFFWRALLRITKTDLEWRNERHNEKYFVIHYIGLVLHTSLRIIPIFYVKRLKYIIKILSNA